MRHATTRWWSLGFAALALAGCGGGGGGGDGGPIVFLEDDFSSGTLSQWVVTAGDPAIDGAYGNAAPSVFMFKAANAAPGDGLRANRQFDPRGGLVLTVQVSNRATSGEGQLTVLFDTNNAGNTCAAGVNIYRTHALYELTNGSSQPTADNAFIADTDWHTYSLVLTASGAMVWYRDGAAQLSAPAYIGCQVEANLLRLMLSAGGNADESNANFDNVQVVRP